MFSRRNTHSSLRSTVLEDWFTILPREKGHVFEAVVSRWECTYAMMSVSLNEALSLRASGELVCARQQVSIAAELLGRLSASLVSLCEILSARGKRIEVLPVVAPLNTDFFRGDTGQSAASWNVILHRVLLRDRSRFFQKLRILSATLDRLELEFHETAAEISEGASVDPGDSWARLDQLHYDFNTCLREAEVVLKAFLRLLPAEQLPALADEFDAPAVLKRLKPRLSRASV